MHIHEIEKINACLGKIIDATPVPLLFFDADDGTVLRYNERARKAIVDTTGLTDVPQTLYSNIGNESFVVDKLRNHDEFEFYVTYERENSRFVALTHTAGSDLRKVLIVSAFNAVDGHGNYVSNAVVIRPMADSARDILSSDLEAAKYITLSKAFGLAELVFHPREMTLDVIGGRDNYKFQGAPLEQVSKLIHSEDEDIFVDSLADASVQFPERIKFTVRVYSIKLKNYRYFRMMFYPQIDSMGNVQQYTGFCFDATDEEIAMKRKVEEAQALMEKAAEPQSESNIVNALANISHDLRNLVGIVSGISNIMSDTTDSEKLKKHNETIQNSTERMQRMINEIMNLNKVESGSVDVQCKKFDLEAMLHKQADIYKLQFHSKGLVLDFISHNQPYEIESDERRILEIMDNYLSNALKYTESGKVTISYETVGDNVRIHVTDTGMGISEEDCPKVFNRFERLGNTLKGNGIGLHICQGVAKALGGSVGVTSKPGEGSDFWVEIPRK